MVLDQVRIMVLKWQCVMSKESLRSKIPSNNACNAITDSLIWAFIHSRYTKIVHASLRAVDIT